MQPITKPLGILPTTTFEGIKQSKTHIRFSTTNGEHIFIFQYYLTTNTTNSPNTTKN